MPESSTPQSRGLGNSILAIVAGGLADVILSAVLGFALSLCVVMGRHLETLPPDEMLRMVTKLHDLFWYRALDILVGLSCSVMGGYIAASIAKQHKLRNGMLASWLCVTIGLFSQLDFGVGALLWRLVQIAMTPLCYLAGAYWRTRSHVAAD